MPIVPVNQNGFPMRLGDSMNYGVPQRDPAQPDFMQKFVQLLMQLRAAPPQQPQGIPGVSGAPVQNPAPSQTPPPMIGGRG